MRHHRVAGVGLVLDHHLPIAVVHVAQHAAGDLQLSGRRAVDHVVEARQAFAEELLEARAGVVELGEHEAAIVVHVAHRAHALGGVALLRGRCSRSPCAAGSRAAYRRCGTSRRDTAQRKNFPVLPQVSVVMRVPLCGQRLCSTFTVPSVWRTITHRLGADRGAEIVARVRHLAVVADIDPGVGEQVLHLELEHFLVDIDVAMDFGLANEAAHGFGISAISVSVHRCASSSSLVTGRSPAAASSSATRKSASACPRPSRRPTARNPGDPGSLRSRATWQMPQSPRLQSWIGSLPASIKTSSMVSRRRHSEAFARALQHHFERRVAGLRGGRRENLEVQAARRPAEPLRGRDRRLDHRQRPAAIERLAAGQRRHQALHVEQAGAHRRYGWTDCRRQAPRSPAETQAGRANAGVDEPVRQSSRRQARPPSRRAASRRCRPPAGRPAYPSRPAESCWPAAARKRHRRP